MSHCIVYFSNQITHELSAESTLACRFCYIFSQGRSQLVKCGAADKKGSQFIYNTNNFRQLSKTDRVPYSLLEYTLYDALLKYYNTIIVFLRGLLLQ